MNSGSSHGQTIDFAGATRHKVNGTRGPLPGTTTPGGLCDWSNLPNRIMPCITAIKCRVMVLARPTAKTIVHRRNEWSSQSLPEGARNRSSLRLDNKRLKGRGIVDLREDELGVTCNRTRRKDRWPRRRTRQLKSICHCYVVHRADGIR